MISVAQYAGRHSAWVVRKDANILMERINEAIESYETEIRELKSIISNLEAGLNEEKCANKALVCQMNRLQGMVEAFEICVKARK